jgi:hypothetical protein
MKDIAQINIAKLYKDIGCLYFKKLYTKSSSSEFSSHPSYVSQGQHINHIPIFKDGSTVG